MRLYETRLVAAREVREALRSRWFVAAAASFFVLSLALSWLGLAGAGRAELAGFDRTTASLLNLALLFVPLVTLPIGGLCVAGELEDSSLSLLLAQPVTRAEVWCGKYLGLLAAVGAAVLLGFGLTGLVVAVAAGGARAGTFIALVGVLLLYAAVTLAIGYALSVALRSRARVVGAAFGVWLAMVYLSDLGTIGLAVLRALRPGQVFALALLNPAQQARVLGTLVLSERLDVLGPVGIFGQETFGVAGLAALLAGTLVALSLGCLGGGALFRKVVVP
jgi:Cu-processing system permease protein